MADYVRKAINSCAERRLYTPLTRANFATIMNDFISADITGVTKSFKQITVSVPLLYSLASGEKLLTIVVSVGRKDASFFDSFDTILSQLLTKYKNDTAIKTALATAAGVQASSVIVEELPDAVYKAEFECSCAEDTSFQTVITPRAIYYNNYGDDAAPTAVDGWCDTKPLLKQTA